jgi:signal transduction histidine kinase
VADTAIVRATDGRRGRGRDPLDYRGRLRGRAAALTLLEAVVVLGPLSAFVSFSARQLAVLQVAAPLLVVAVLLVYLPLERAILTPLDRCIAHKRRGEAISQELAQAAYSAILHAPQRIAWMRASAWFVLIGGCALTLRATAGFPAGDIPVLVTIATLHTYAVAVMRGIVWARLLRALRSEILPNVDPIRLFGDTYRHRIVEVAITTGAIGIGAAALFIYYFIPISPAAYKALEAWFAPTVAGLTLLWYAWIRRMPAAIDQYVARRDDQTAAAAYREAQALPFKLAGSKVVAWLLAAAAAALQGLAFGVEGESATLIFAAVLILIIGVAQFEVLWQRATLRPLLQHLAARHRFPVGDLPWRMGLRAKMLGGFGGLMFFACGLSMLWAFVQYRSFAQKVIRTDAETELARAQQALAGARTAADVRRYVAGRSDGVLSYVAPGESARGPRPPASARLVTRGGQDLGLLLARPSARIHSQQQIISLAAFFLALMGLSAGLITILVRDLTDPVRQLEQRAVEMARGELARPVVATGDADEIGRLTFAFEEMRRALRDKLRSTESLSVALEREVMRRTEDLEHTNRELRSALENLKRAQDELVRSEKLASMGRLVAGIAHEINNPINAMVNSLGPLEEILRERLGGDVPGEMREMFEVIQRGAGRTKVIVQALHSYSRGDTERLVAVDLHRGLDESLELLRHHLKKGITVDRRYGEVGRVQGYAGQLQQVFMNLLTNAAQAMAGQDGTIRIETARVGRDVVIRIADDGPGISAAILPRIFDPFFTTKDVGQGSGLGLSIVHGIVERHGGRIDVESQVGQGTTFTVTLPQEAA